MPRRNESVELKSETERTIFDISGQYRPPAGPVYKGNPFSLLTFWPANRLISISAKKKLNVDDVWTLNNDDMSNSIYKKLNDQWKKQLLKKKPSLLSAVISTFSRLFILSILLQSLYAILSFATPLLLPYVISYLEFDGKRTVDGFTVNKIPYWYGIIYLLAIILANIGGTLAMFHSQMLTWSFGIRMRSGLILLVYNKVLKILSADNADAGQVVNMISTDSQLFLDSVIYFSQGFVAPLQAIITTVLLWFQIKYYSLIPIALFVLSFPLNAFITSRIAVYRKKLQHFSDIRLKYINEFIDSIKTIKFYTWELPFITNIKNARKKEIQKIRSLLLWRSFMQFLMLNVPTVGLGITFIVYSIDNTLTTTIVFTTISLMQLLRSSFVAFPVTVSFYGQYKVAFNRIQEYLLRRDNKRFKPSKKLDNDFAVSITNANATYDEETIILENINLNIKKGEFIMIVGAVGSGKSTLGKAIIGEVILKSGKVKVSDYVAYVPQDPYIVNGTLRENILFGMEYNEEKYDKVIEACSLKADLDYFPSRDLTEIGEKGANLSGGQRQRINIARALYSDRNILLLDDPLSALDSQVSESIFRNVILSSFDKGKTIILITNNLNGIKIADKIVLLKDGKIEQVGDFDQLMDYTTFSEMVTGHTVISNKPSLPVLTKKESSLFIENRRQSFIREKFNDDIPDKLIEDEEKDTSSISMKHYFKYFKSGSLLRFIIYLFAVTIRSGARLGGTIWLATWSSDNSENPKFTQNQYLYIYLGFVVGEALFTWIYSSLLVNFSTKASRKLHSKLLKSIASAKTTFFDKTPIGRLFSRFSKDISFIDIPLPNNIEHLNSNVFTLLGIVIGIAVGNPYALIAVVVAFILYMLLSNYYRRASIQIQRQEAVSRAPIFSHMSETMVGIDVIRSFQKEKEFSVFMSSKIDQNTADYLSLKICAMWFGMRLDWLGLIIIISTYVAVLVTRQLTIIDVALASLALSYTTGISSYLASSSALIAEVDTKLNAVERVKQYCKIEHEDNLGTPPPDEWPSKGEIHFENMVVEYIEDHPVINDLTLNIKPGEKIGIVGRTGAGKSTFLTSLFRSVEPKSGKIEIDGIDISTIPLYDLRRRISYIPQNPSLFTGTIRYNLDPFGNKDDNELWEALSKVELKEYVNSLPNKLDEEVEEKGHNFSLGQRQLFSIARILLEKNKIVVIDEATASVDIETNSLIQKMIRKHFADKTVLTIAHMLDTIMDSDRVLVMEKGRAIEFGEPLTLLKKRGKFHSMVAATGNENAIRLYQLAEQANKKSKILRKDTEEI